MKRNRNGISLFLKRKITGPRIAARRNAAQGNAAYRNAAKRNEIPSTASTGPLQVQGMVALEILQLSKIEKVVKNAICMFERKEEATTQTPLANKEGADQIC